MTLSFYILSNSYVYIYIYISSGLMIDAFLPQLQIILLLWHPSACVRFRSHGGASGGTNNVWQTRGRVTAESVELFVTLLIF